MTTKRGVRENTGPHRVLEAIRVIADELDVLPTQSMIADHMGVSQQYVSQQMKELSRPPNPCIRWLTQRLYRVVSLRYVDESEVSAD